MALGTSQIGGLFRNALAEPVRNADLGPVGHGRDGAHWGKLPMRKTAASIPVLVRVSLARTNRGRNPVYEWSRVRDWLCGQQLVVRQFKDIVPDVVIAHVTGNATGLAVRPRTAMNPGFPVRTFDLSPGVNECATRFCSVRALNPVQSPAVLHSACDKTPGF